MTNPVFFRARHLAAHPARMAILSALGLSLSAPVALAQVQLPQVPVSAVTDAEADADPLLSPGAFSQSGAALDAKRLATSDTAQLLKDLPGVSLYAAGGVSSLPALRGLADDRLKTLVDGIPITASCPNHMNPTFSYIDPNKVAKVEVMAGITPVSAGGDSIGGTISVESADPTFAKAGEGIHTEGRLSTTYRSTSHGITVGGNVAAATQNVSVGYDGSWAKAGDYHRGGDNNPVQTSRYQVENHALTVGVRHDQDLLVVQGGWQFSPHEGFPNQRMDLTENTSKFLNARYDGKFGWGELDARAYWRDVSHEMNFLGRVKGTNMPMNTESDEVGYSVKATVPLNPRDTLRVGNEFQRYTLDDWWPPISAAANGMMSPNDFWNIRDGERNRVGTFAEWEAKWDSRWTTLLGVRNDTVWMDTGAVQGYSNNAMAAYGVDASRFNAFDHARTDVNFDATALARFDWDKTHTIEGGYARKTRSPSLYERYSWSTGTMASNMNNWTGDGNGYVGNPDLNPEVAHTVSLSGDWHDSTRKVWNIKVSPYYTYVEDYIDADRYSTFTSGRAFGKLRLANHDAQLYGVDISGHARLLDSPAYGQVSVRGTLGWVNGENLDTGDNLYNIMPLNGRLTLDHRLGGWSNAIEVEGAAAKNGVSHTRNEIPTPAYALLNLRTGYEWTNVALTAGIDNVFNTLYHLPLGGVDYSDYRQWGTNVAGPGRSYMAGVTVKF